MNVTRKSLAAIGLTLCLGGAAVADDVPVTDKPSLVPATREDLKKALEASKKNVPRLPLPAPTAEDIAKAQAAAKARAEAAAKNGQPDVIGKAMGSGVVNNGRMRALYLSDYGTAVPLMPMGVRQGQGKTPEPTEDFAFQTKMFWIISRGNNCTYCTGHQETKLASTGMSDDQIASLDGEWFEFTPAERAAFAFAKKSTFQPFAIGDADIAALKAHYTDAQILDIISAVGGFNAMNRWTGALRIPQEDHREYLTPTSSKYTKKASILAQVGETTTGMVPPVPRKRPALEARAEVERALDAARKRTPRLALVDESATKAAIEASNGNTPPQWMRLLATRPEGANNRVLSFLNAETKGKLDPETKAIIAWTAARNDHAWYALGHAKARLNALGYSDDKIFSLDDWDTTADDKTREVVRFARILTIDPALITDGDFARMKKHFDDQKIAEIVHQATVAASFDRVTEAAGLRLEK